MITFNVHRDEDELSEIVLEIREQHGPLLGSLRVVTLTDDDLDRLIIEITEFVESEPPRITTLSA